MLLLLQLKTGFWRALPYFFAVLAHVLEETVRAAGRTILALWRANPVKALHHRMTWRLLRPGAWFGEELIKFVEGYVQRMSLSKAFRCQLGIFRLWPTNETTVEEKHARLALAAISRRLGAVRISLTNRLIMMEHMLSMGWVKVTEIIHFFDKARRLTQCPQMFGLEAHPSLAELHNPHPVLLRKLFARVVYRTDLSCVFQNVRAIGKRNENRKKKQGRDIARLLVQSLAR